MARRPLREVPLSALRSAECREFLQYWESKRTGPAPPFRGSFDPLTEKPRLAPNLFIQEVLDAGRDFRLRLAGTNIVTLFGTDPTGRLLSGFWFGGEVEAVLDLLRRCVTAGEPVAMEGSFHWRGFRQWECVAAPMRIDGPGAGQILGCIYEAP
jgi:hypothetical protein